ncbi:MAG: hypothetical protein ACFFDN_40275 [Candidatus Hodarchaeota archaeon]
MDYEHFAIKFLFEQLIDVLIGRITYKIFMQTTGKLVYLRNLGISEDMLDACVDFYRGQSFTHNFLFYLIDIIFDQSFSSISEGKSIIYEILATNKFLGGELTKFQETLENIEQIFRNFETWLDNLPDDIPGFQIKTINDIIQSITTKITKAYEGKVDNIVTPYNIYPVSSAFNFLLMFNLIHNTLRAEQILEGAVDLYSMFTGTASIVSFLRGGVIEAALWGILTLGGLALKSALQIFEFGLIIGQFVITVFILSDIIYQAINYQLIFLDIIDFITNNAEQPINFNDMKIDIISLESPNEYHLFESIEYGSLTVKNTGTVDGNVIVSVNILTSDLKTVDRYYLYQYILAGEEFTFTTAYYGRTSDYFGFEPYIIEFAVYMNGKCFGLANDVFFVGVLETLNNMANQIIDTSSLILEQGSNVWDIIITRMGDLWTTIWGGKAASNIDVRLWNEDRTTLLVGYDYSTHEIVNLIGANYSGPEFNPEYIRIPFPNGTTYYVELIGVDLPYSEETYLFYMNTGVRSAIIGHPLEVNKTLYIDDEDYGNFTIHFPIIELGGQKAIESLVLNCTSLQYLGNDINPTFNKINISLNAGEYKYLSLNFSYSSKLVEGNYTGLIMLFNETTLMVEIPVYIQVINRTILYALKEEGAPQISDPIISNTSPMEFTNVKITVNVKDDTELQSIYLFYFVNNFSTWTSIKLEFDGNDIYSGFLPGQKAGDSIYFKIYAVDNETHISINDNNGNFYSLTFQEFHEQILGFDVLIITILLLGLTTIYYKHYKKGTKK